MPDDFKARWTATVDQSAERARLQFITPGAGQAMVYLLKREEAQTFLRLEPEEQDAQIPQAWPMLSAERPVEPVDSLAGRAAVIVALAGQWRLAAARIEDLRLAAKAAIDAASDEAEARAFAQAAMRDWPKAG